MSVGDRRPCRPSPTGGSSPLSFCGSVKCKGTRAALADFWAQALASRVSTLIPSSELVGDRVAPCRGSGFAECSVDVSVSSNTRGKQRQQSSQSPRELPGG